MTADWQCPKCGKEEDCGRYGDLWSYGGEEEFIVECECGWTYRINVYWEPLFEVSSVPVRKLA